VLAKTVVFQVSHKLHGKVNGLCGRFNGNSTDDKSKPDGSNTVRTEDFLNSWKVPDSQVTCAEQACSVKHQATAERVCREIK